MRYQGAASLLPVILTRETILRRSAPEKAAYNAAGQLEIADLAAIAEARPDEERTQELKH
jgi:hypothetical protein